MVVATTVLSLARGRSVDASQAARRPSPLHTGQRTGRDLALRRQRRLQQRQRRVLRRDLQRRASRPRPAKATASPFSFGLADPGRRRHPVRRAPDPARPRSRAPRPPTATTATGSPSSGPPGGDQAFALGAAHVRAAPGADAQADTVAVRDRPGRDPGGERRRIPRPRHQQLEPTRTRRVTADTVADLSLFDGLIGLDGMSFHLEQTSVGDDARTSERDGRQRRRLRHPHPRRDPGTTARRSERRDRPAEQHPRPARRAGPRPRAGGRRPVRPAADTDDFRVGGQSAYSDAVAQLAGNPQVIELQDQLQQGLFDTQQCDQLAGLLQPFPQINALYNAVGVAAPDPRRRRRQRPRRRWVGRLPGRRRPDPDRRHRLPAAPTFSRPAPAPPAPAADASPRPRRHRPRPAPRRPRRRPPSPPPSAVPAAAVDDDLRDDLAGGPARVLVRAGARSAPSPSSCSSAACSPPTRSGAAGSRRSTRWRPHDDSTDQPCAAPTTGSCAATPPSPGSAPCSSSWSCWRPPSHPNRSSAPDPPAGSDADGAPGGRPTPGATAHRRNRRTDGPGSGTRPTGGIPRRRRLPGVPGARRPVLAALRDMGRWRQRGRHLRAA